MGTACPPYQPGLAPGHRLRWWLDAESAARPRRVRLPLTVAVVGAVWAIYWFPGVPLGVLQAVKCGTLAAMFVVALLAARRSRGETRPMSRAGVWWLAAVVLATLPGMVFSPEPAESATVWSRYPVAMLVYLAVRQVYLRDPRRIASAARWLTVPVLLSVGYVLLALAGLPHVEPPQSFVRSYGSEAHLMGLSYRTSGLAWAIAFVAPVMAFYAFRAATLAKRLAWGLALGASMGVSFLLMNRGGLLAALVAPSLVAFFLARSRAGRWGLWLLAVPLLGFVALRATTAGVFEQRASAWERLVAGQAGVSELDRLSSGRVGRYTTALTIIARYPAAGLGFRGADEEYGLTSAQAHNLYLSVALGAGMLAGATVVLFFGRVALLWLGAARRLLSRRLPPFAVVPLAMLVPHFLGTLIESGPMFTSLYSGITFWFALPALELFLAASPRERAARQRAMQADEELRAEP